MTKSVHELGWLAPQSLETMALEPHGILCGAILICLTCEGEGGYWWWDNEEGDFYWGICPDCDGSGIIWQ